MLSAQQLAQKWARNLGASTEAIKNGVAAVTTSPTAKAANRADAYVMGVQKAVADGKWQAGLRRVTLEDWKNSMLTKGVNRIGQGALAAQSKMESFLADFLPHVQSGVTALASMPRGDLAQNIQRAVFMMEHNSKFRRRS